MRTGNMPLDDQMQLKERPFLATHSFAMQRALTTDVIAWRSRAHSNVCTGTPARDAGRYMVDNLLNWLAAVHTDPTHCWSIAIWKYQPAPPGMPVGGQMLAAPRKAERLTAVLCRLLLLNQHGTDCNMVTTNTWMNAMLSANRRSPVTAQVAKVATNG